MCGADEAQSPEIEDYYMLNREYPIHYNIAEDKELQIMENENHSGNPEDIDIGDEPDNKDNATIKLYEGQSAVKRVRDLLRI